MTVDRLLSMSEAVKEFGANLKELLHYDDIFTKISRYVKNGSEEASKSIREFTGELQFGDTGEEVKDLQRMLKDLNYNIGQTGVDGIFGEKTKKALNEFKKESG